MSKHKVSDEGFSKETIARMKSESLRRLHFSLTAAKIALANFQRSPAATHVHSTGTGFNLAAERLRRLQAHVKDAQANLDRFTSTEGLQGETVEASEPEACGM